MHPSTPNAAAAGSCPRCRTESYLTLFQGSDRLYRTTEREFNVVECSRCGMIRIDPMPTPEELASFYPQSYWWEADRSATGRLTDLYRRFVISDHVRFVVKALHDAGPAPVLDLGCGGGSFLHALHKRGAEVVGADFSQRAAEICWSRLGIPAACATLPYPPFRDGSFSVVTLFHVLEHLPDPMAALESAWYLLTPGGRLVVQVPNAACWQLLVLGERWSGLDVPRHLINFRVEDIEELLESCGFEVLRRKFFSLRDNPAGLATSLCPGLDPVSRKVRGVKESSVGALLKNLLYLGLTTAAVPLTLLEAAGSAGSTIMIEARRRGDA